MKTDFDFFIGTWNSRHRRLRKVLAGCDEWDEFPGATRCWGVLDGAGNIDEILFPTLVVWAFELGRLLPNCAPGAR